MTIVITDDSINCDACISECPNNVIYSPDKEWSYADETNLSGSITLLNGSFTYANEMNMAKSDEFTFIVTEKCTECKGLHDEPQCTAVCPVDCCIADEYNNYLPKKIYACLIILFNKKLYP